MSLDLKAGHLSINLNDQILKVWMAQRIELLVSG